MINDYHIMTIFFTVILKFCNYNFDITQSASWLKSLALFRSKDRRDRFIQRASNSALESLTLKNQENSLFKNILEIFLVRSSSRFQIYLPTS